MVYDTYKTNAKQPFSKSETSPFPCPVMEEHQSHTMKEERMESSLTSETKELNQDEKYREKYQNNVLPAIKQALKDDWLNVRSVC